MEIKPSALPTDAMDRGACRLAGVTSIVLGLAGAGAILALALTTRGGKSADLTVIQAAWVVLFALTAIAGANLLRSNCAWSQRLLLTFWLATMILSLVVGAMALLWGAPAWFGEFFHAPLAAVIIPVLIVSAAQGVLLVRATSANSRMRYGAMVTVSIAMAAALVVVVNIIAQKDPYHKDLETLGQYGLSVRTRNVLETIDQPVQLTIIYTSADKDRRGGDFRDPVVELAQEMQREMANRHKPPLAIVNVTTDADRAAILARLQQQSAGAAPAHKAMLDNFVAAGEKLINDIGAQKTRWEAFPAESFIGLWGIEGMIQQALDDAAQQITQARNEVQQQLSRGVPDMGMLTNNVKAVTKNASDSLQRISDQLDKIGKLPAAVQANRADALKSIDACRQTVKEMMQTLGNPKDPPPKDPTDALKKFVSASNRADETLTATGKKLSEIAGKDNVALLSQSRAWGVTVPDPRSGMVLRTNMGQICVMWGRIIQAQAAEAEASAANLNAEAQGQYVVELRNGLVEMGGQLDAQLANITQGLDSLTKVDEASAGVLKLSADKTLFADLLTPIRDILSAAEKLPELKSSTLSQDITGENIVLVEMGSKTEVVPFESVWPLKYRGPFQMSAGDGADKRVFNGDTAITSKLLTMAARKPFATVYVTYVAPPLPPQAAQMRLNPDLRPWNTIVARLKESNFEVKEWNLNEPMPADEPSTESTQPAGDKNLKVLLVLPFAPGTRVFPNPYGPPQTDFTPELVDKIRQELDNGTAGLFLTQFMADGQDALLAYLKSDWGVDVTRETLVFPATPDENAPGQFRLDMKRLMWLPLNNFAANPPVGLPLRSQRVLWQQLCPIEKTPLLKISDKTARTVTYLPLLTVPEARDVWGMTRQNVEAAGAKLLVTGKSGEDFISPNYAAGDMRSPMDVAVAVTCPKSDTVQDNRIIVASMGVSVSDMHLMRRVEEKDGKFSDPPKANADFVSNAVYWLIGRQQYIGSGPAQIRPVEISAAQMRVVWPIVIVVLPLLVLGAGGLVMLMRRGR